MTILSTCRMCMLAMVLFAFTMHGSVAVKQTMGVAAQHLEAMDKANSDVTMYPRSTKKDGSLFTVNSRDWTSGFIPGSMWLMYDQTSNKEWEQMARKWTASLEKEQFNKGTHDLGFMLFCSFGNGYRLTSDAAYKAILIQGAKSLITRFNKKAGVIKSWDHNTDKWQYPVIIDNMMNLELLYWASKTTGDPVYKNVANTHALTTIKNHFRANNSSFHVIDYDTLTGQVRNKLTHQGYADGSAWARGQAWGLYGYTVAYRETKDKRFVDQANKIARFIINHPKLAADKIPYWDYDDPRLPNIPRDASAAAITASALLELKNYPGADKKVYTTFAGQLLESLSTDQYLAKTGSNNNFILMHSTGHLPNNSEIDTPINYADYYFIEALMRYGKIGGK